MIERFTKSSKLIGMTLDKLHVFGDCLRTLDGILKFILDFLNTCPRDGRAYVFARVSQASWEVEDY